MEKYELCMLLNFTNTHSEYVILISNSLQQYSYERASVLRHTHIACLVDK